MKHISPPGHIILIQSQSAIALTPYWCVLSGEATTYQC